MSRPTARKSTNLSLTAHIVAEAREMKINISRVADESIARAVAAEKARLWKAENREAFDYWNKHFEEHGLPLAKYRQF